MSSDLIVEDGIDEAGFEPKSRSGWFLVGIGFALGLALGTMASLPGLSTSGEDPMESDGTGASADAPSREDLGISVVVPGFPDALVAISGGSGSGLEHVLWPVGGSPVVRPMTHGRDVRIDTSGDYYALSTSVPDLGGVVLSAGRSSNARPIQARVTSYTWHDSERGQLAYTSEDAAGWQLLSLTPSFRPVVVPTAAYPGGSVAAWGNWGFAIQTTEDGVVLLTPSGEFKDREVGVALASHPSGWVLVQDGGFKLVSAGGGVRQLGLPEPNGPSFSAAFSPDGRRIAVGGTFGLIVYDQEEENSVTLADVRAPRVSWSSDSRFVVVPSQRGVLIYDVEAEELLRVLVGRSTLAAAAAPLSSS